MSLLIENFYLFFEGIMLFQVLFFMVLFLQSKRKHLLYYSLLNLFAATYFFLNAPDTFLRIQEDVVFTWPLYPYVNFAILLSLTIVYLYFLAEIFQDTISESAITRITFRYTVAATPAVYFAFAFFQYNKWDTNLLFYIGHLLNGGFCTLILLKNFHVKGYRSYIIYGMIVTFIAVLITVWLTIRYNALKNEFVLDHYPLLPVKVGMLIDIILFQIALMGRWQEQQKELVVQKLQTQLEVERVRSRISTELHDDIGSTLSGIHMYSHMARQQAETGNKETTDKSLAVIQEASGDMIKRLKDMVWAIQPGHDTLNELLEKIQEYAVFMAGAKQMEVTVSLPEGVSAFKISTEWRHHVFMIAKEIINNAVKYSGGNRLLITTEVEQGDFILKIEDNGCGFNKTDAKKGNGLENIEKRAEEMGATLELNTSMGRGTEWVLQAKIT